MFCVWTYSGCCLGNFWDCNVLLTGVQFENWGVHWTSHWRRTVQCYKWTATVTEEKAGKWIDHLCFLYSCSTSSIKGKILMQFFSRWSMISLGFLIWTKVYLKYIKRAKKKKTVLRELLQFTKCTHVYRRIRAKISKPK